jgi:hypothetical protein
MYFVIFHNKARKAAVLYLICNIKIIPMKNNMQQCNFKPILSQLQNNTSHWLGHFPSANEENMVGQTFEAPQSASLDSIRVYSDFVQRPGKVILTFHQFDHDLHQWGPVLGKAEVEAKKHHNAEWMDFQLPHLDLKKSSTYGFRLQSPDALLALGEVAWASKNKQLHGEEWCINNQEHIEHYYKYFSLVFSVGTYH